MIEQLISLETAKLAAEKKFDSPCRFYYNGSGFLTSETYEVQLDHNNRIMFYQAFSAPTQSLLQKWLREVHNIFVGVELIENKYAAAICKTTDGSLLLDGFTITLTYEEALEEGLLEALKLINYERTKSLD